MKIKLLISIKTYVDITLKPNSSGFIEEQY